MKGTLLTRKGAITPALTLLSAVSAGLLASCWLLPMGVPEYEFRTDGPPLYFFDDFEQNDGDFSTRYFYERKGPPRPSLQSDFVYGGEVSAVLEAGSKLTTTITVPEAGDFTFRFFPGTWYYSSDTSFFVVSDNDWDVELTVSDDSFSKQWASASFWLDAGEHEISWENRYSYDYEYAYVCLDDLCFAGFMETISPQDQQFLSSSPAVLDWSDLPGAEKYHLQLSYADTFTDLAIDENALPESEHALPGPLETGKRCCWRVRPFRDGEWCSWGLTRSFFVRGSLVSDSFEVHDGRFSTLNAWGLDGDVLPHLQSAESYDGSLAVEFGRFEEGVSGFFTEVDHPAVRYVTYRAKVEDNGKDPGDLCIDLDAGSTTIYPAVGSWSLHSFLLPAGQIRIEWRNRRYGNDEARLWIDDIGVFDVGTFEGDNFDDNDGTTSNAYDWFYGGVTPPRLVGAGADWEIMFSGFEDGDSDLICYTNFSEAKIIEFYVSFISYWGGDLGVWVDGVNVRYIYPTKYIPHSSGGWEQTPEISAGIHEIVFRNRRFGDNAYDSVWIDNITVTTP